MSGRMEGKKVVVVGAGQLPSELLGNGRAIATTFAREGAEICAVDLFEERAAQTVDDIRSAGGTAHLLTADVEKVEDCARLVEESHAAMGRIDALVNVVGVQHGDSTLEDIEPGAWQQVFDINLRSQWLTSRAVVPFMKEQGGGSILNISTVGSRTGGGRLFAYSISKAGVNALTHFIAVEYAPHNIRCNAILPSFVVTPHSVEGLRDAGYAVTLDDYYALGAKSVPLGRMGSAMDIAHAALFLSSDEANFITGVELPVDGGTLAIIGQYQRREH